MATSLLNVLWSDGGAHASILSVHQSIANAIGVKYSSSWILQGAARTTAVESDTIYWDLPKTVLKARLRAYPWQFLFQKKFALEIQRLRPRIIILDGLGAGRLVLPVLKKNADTKIIMVFHGETKFRSSDVRMLSQFPQDKLSLVAVSDYLAGVVTAALPSWRAGVHAIRTVIPPAVFQRSLLDREAALRELGLDPAFRYLGGVGRLVESKGWATLIGGFISVSVRFPELKLVLLGEGPEREKIERTISDNGLTDRVTLFGHREDARKLYKAFDWTAVPSTHEGLGLVVQESVFSGVPVLLSDIQVFREQLGDAGLFAPPGDALSWGRLLSYALSCDRQKIAAQQIAEIEERVSFDRFSAAYRKLL